MQPTPPAGIATESYLSCAMLDLMLTPQLAFNDSAPWHKDWPKETTTLNPKVARGLGWGVHWGIQTDGEHPSLCN